MGPPLPVNEHERLEALQRYQILDSEPEAAFDRITQTAARFFNVPIALISLVDQDRQWLKSRCGLEVSETPREIAFCAHTILGTEPMVVADATLDPRFAANPSVVGEPHIRFYAGAPIRTSDGFNLGSLCVIDTEPRQITVEERVMLEQWAAIVLDQLELRITQQNLSTELATRARTEEKLRASEAKFRAVAQSAGDAIISADEEGQIEFWNHGAERIFGHSGADMLGQPLSRIMPERFRQTYEAGMACSRATGENRVLGQTGELLGMHQRGHEFPIELTLSSWEANGRTFFTAIVRDITGRKLADDELKRSAARLAEAQSAARLGSWEVDLATGQTLWSDEMFHLLGLEKEKVRPSHERFLECVHPEDRPRVCDFTPALLATHKPPTIDLRIVHPNGDMLSVQRHASVVLDETGVPVRMFGILQDITERKQNEAVLQKEREFLSALLENLTDAIVSCDAEGRLTMLNRATRQIHQDSFTEIPPERWAEHFGLFLADGETQMRMEEIPLYRALHGEKLRDVEMVVATDDAPSRSFLASGQSFFDAEAHKLGAVIAMHDITERKAAEAKAEASANRLRQLCDITSKGESSFEDKVRAVLDLSRHEFGLDNATFAELFADEFVVRYASWKDDETAEEFRCPLADTTCQELFVTHGPIAFEHASDSEWATHPGFLRFGFESYIGAPVYVRGTPHGSLSFTSTQPRTEKFTESDKEFLRLLAQWVGGEIERQQTEDALKQAREDAAQLQLEASRRESIQRYTFLADSMPQIVWTARPDGFLEYVNRAWTDRYRTHP